MGRALKCDQSGNVLARAVVIVGGRLDLVFQQCVQFLFRRRIKYRDGVRKRRFDARDAHRGDLHRGFVCRADHPARFVAEAHAERVEALRKICCAIDEKEVVNPLIGIDRTAARAVTEHIVQRKIGLDLF